MSALLKRYIFVILSFSLLPILGATIIVDKNAPSSTCIAGDKNSSTIQGALNIAENNDTIKICPGAYKEYINTGSSLSNLTITSTTSNASDVIIESTNSHILSFFGKVTNLTIKDLTFNSNIPGNQAAINLSSTGGEIKFDHVDINVSGTGSANAIYISEGNGESILTIENSSVVGRNDGINANNIKEIIAHDINISAEKYGIYLTKAGGDHNLSDINISKAAKNDGIHIEGGSSAVLENVSVAQAGQDGIELRGVCNITANNINIQYTKAHGFYNYSGCGNDNLSNIAIKDSEERGLFYDNSNLGNLSLDNISIGENDNPAGNEGMYFSGSGNIDASNMQIDANRTGIYIKGSGDYSFNNVEIPTAGTDDEAYSGLQIEGDDTNNIDLDNITIGDFERIAGQGIFIKNTSDINATNLDITSKKQGFYTAGSDGNHRLQDITIHPSPNDLEHGVQIDEAESLDISGVCVDGNRSSDSIFGLYLGSSVKDVNVTRSYFIGGKEDNYPALMDQSDASSAAKFTFNCLMRSPVEHLAKSSSKDHKFSNNYWEDWDSSMEYTNNFNVTDPTPLSQCPIDPTTCEFNATLAEQAMFQPPGGIFDGWDNFRNINDRNISTKIAGKPFTITLASLNMDNNETEIKNGNIVIKYRLYDIGNGVAITDWQDFNISSNKEKNVTFDIDNAAKRVKVNFKFCQKRNSDPIYLAMFEKCENSPSDHEYNTTTYSSDGFAIRPDRFSIEVTSTFHTAGEIFDINFTAPNRDGNPTRDYNETAGTSFQIKYHELKDGCLDGNFTPSLDTIKFDDGIRDIDLSNKEIGDVNLSISDETLPCTQRFSAIDCNDKNISGKWNSDTGTAIGTDYRILHFSPDHFSISSLSFTDFHHENGANFTYLSNDGDFAMRATLEFDIDATAKDGNTTKNYNEKCYSKETNATIEYVLSRTPSGIHDIRYGWEDDNATPNSDKNRTAISTSFKIFNLPKEIFNTDHNGTARLKIFINFDRNGSLPENPLKLQISNIDITESANPDVSTLLAYAPENNATFYYARLHAPDYETSQDSIATPIYAEIYSDQNSSEREKYGIADLNESVDDVRWWINPHHTPLDGAINSLTPHMGFSENVDPDVTVTFSNTFTSGINQSPNVSYSSRKRPHKTRIWIDASDWMKYHRFITNHDKQLTYSVTFIGTGDWAGIGSLDTNSTIRESNASRGRIEW